MSTFAVAALRGHTHRIRERVIGPFPRAPIGENATVDRRVTPVRTSYSARRIPRAARAMSSQVKSIAAITQRGQVGKLVNPTWNRSLGTPAPHYSRGPLAWDRPQLVVIGGRE
jgi:hypothetical protein